MQSKISELLMTLIAKASGPVGISARKLRETAEHISQSLIKIFYLSIKSGSFLSLWKTSNIVPIPRANDNHNPSNYRPLSLLSTLHYCQACVHEPTVCQCTVGIPKWNRDQKVLVNGATCNSLSVISGVPQGSVLYRAITVSNLNRWSHFNPSV